MAATLRCPFCSSASPDTGLCAICTAELGQILAGAPELLAQLHIQTTRQTSAGPNHTPRAPSAGPAIPIDIHAADTARTLGLLLHSWAAAVLEGHAQPANPATAARALGAALPTLRVHDAAADILGELRETCRAAWPIIDRRARDRIFVGDCPALITRPGDPEHVEKCATALRVAPGAEQVECWRCHTVHQVAVMLAARDELIGGHLATVAEIAACRWRLPDGSLLTAKKIEGYVRRGTVVRRATSRTGAALLLIGEVRAAATRAAATRVPTPRPAEKTAPTGTRTA